MFKIYSKGIYSPVLYRKEMRGGLLAVGFLDFFYFFFF